MRRCASLVLLVGLAPLALWGHRPLSAQIGLQEVTRLSFEGNRRFSDRVLANAIITRETECRSPILMPFCWAGARFSLDPSYFNERDFLRDAARVQVFYFQRGYRGAVVDTVVHRPSREEVRVSFRIQEGEPVRVTEVRFEGTEDLPDPSIAEGLPMRPGDPLSLIALDATRDTLELRLRNGGFAHAEVLRNYFIPRETPLEAEVTFDLYPGLLTRFGPLTVEGNAKVEEAVIRRMLPFREGDVYSQDLLFAGQRNLYNLDIFRFVGVEPDTASVADSVLPLTIRVSEGDVHRVRAGAGLTTAEYASAEARWSSRNFYGGARRLQITGRVSNLLSGSLESVGPFLEADEEFGRLNWLLSADFTQPWLFSPRNSLQGSLFWERQSWPDVFVRKSRGLSLGVTRTLAISTPLTLSVRPQFSEVRAAEVFFCSNYLVCTREDIRVLQSGNWLNPVGVSLSRDRRNQALSPTRGYSALVDLEHAASWTGSEFLYTRVLADAAWYTQSRSGWVLASRVRGGWVHPEGFRGKRVEGTSQDIVHPEKRLYAGGSNSVRGFAQNRLGPRVLQVRSVQTLLSSTREDGSPVCSPEEIVDSSCDPGTLDDDRFEPRPTGGTTLLEGSLEVRFPLSGPIWEGATFLDFGQVWGQDSRPALKDVELTPGLGIRYFSPIGPIRVDLAYRFGQGERSQVVTSAIRSFDPELDDPDLRLLGPDGQPLDYLQKDDLVVLGPRVLWGNPPPWSLRRFQVHLSIGQAF
jgi:outer membrane protein assembly complex protein YaeT